jgi:putative oxidoreductase
MPGRRAQRHCAARAQKASAVNRLTVNSGKRRALRQLGYAAAQGGWRLPMTITSMPDEQGPRAMSRLADRIAAMAPPRAAPAPEIPVPPPSIPRSPVVEAALSRAAVLSAQAAQRAEREPRGWLAAAVDGFVTACGFIPYALVGLALRLVAARAFFLDGQSKVDGPRLPLTWRDIDLSVILPMHVKAGTIGPFFGQALPLPPVFAAYAVSYAEFILPLMLLLGFGTRFAALGLLAVTVAIQLYLLPQALWSTHIYWALILLVLLSLGPGQISIDAVFRFLSQRGDRTP